jgi:hypothetical protein
MNYRNNHISLNKILTAALLLAIVLTAPVMAADESGYALLLQSSPAHGGRILPGNGVYKMQIGQDVSLIAVPEKGYRFLYWVGDVGQTDMTRTSVLMDSPKLIVAVFERDEFEDMEPVLMEAAGSAVGGMTGSPYPLTGAGGIRGWNPIIEPKPRPTPPTPPTSDDLPVPGDPFPVPDDNPVPEPMTLLLLGAPAMALMRMRR